MFIAIIVITALLAWKFADWKNWRKYHSSMLFSAIGFLLYCFVYHDHLLLKFNIASINYHIMALIYMFIVIPLIAFIFLSKYPKGIMKQLIYIFIFVLICTSVEFILFKMGKFEYQHGWNSIWSIALYSIIFSILAIHFKKPVYAFILFTLGTFLLNGIFPFKLD
jgi:hypothetical protein